jgi:hypothetical protein
VHDRQAESERDARQTDTDSGKAAASTALPQPPRTSQNVPMNSADSFANMPHLCLLLEMFAADLMPAGARYLAPCPLHVTRAPFDQLFQHVAEQRVVSDRGFRPVIGCSPESPWRRAYSGMYPIFDHGARHADSAIRGVGSGFANFDYMNDTVLPEIREAMMKRWLIFIYGVACYAIGFVTLLYAIGFVGNLVVPKSIDSAPRVSLGLALLIDLIVLALFAIQHSVMARPAFKRWWSAHRAEVSRAQHYLLFSSIALTVMFVFWEPLGGSVWDVRPPSVEICSTARLPFGWFLVFLSTFLINHFDLFGLRQIGCSSSEALQAAAVQDADALSHRASSAVLGTCARVLVDADDDV